VSCAVLCDTLTRRRPLGQSGLAQARRECGEREAYECSGIAAATEFAVEEAAKRRNTLAKQTGASSSSVTASGRAEPTDNGAGED
jgi:hypothetical protein